MRLNDRVALITGASSGIGSATARLLAAEGAKLVLAARNREALEQTAASLPKGTGSLVLPTDISDENQIRRMVEGTVEKFGRIDLLINNAGVGIFKPIIELSTEEFDHVLDVNLRGTFLCLKHALPYMYRQRSGTVITISSIAGKNGFAGGSAYCASKFALMGLMESVFHEARSYDIRVVTLTPGSVNTPFFDEAGMTPPNRNRILQPEDVAATILFAATLPEHALVREIDIRPTNPRGG
jgi:3-oxoacyl-[acyl-carrier protein] reductase